VCSQKKGQVVFVVVVDGRHVTAPWMDKTGRDKRRRRVGWECNISQYCFRRACHRDSIGHCALWISN
jgi:hypothetical protein